MQLTSLLSFVVLAIVASAVPTKERVGTIIPLTKRSTLVDQDGVVNIKALRNQILRASRYVLHTLLDSCLTRD